MSCWKRERSNHNAPGIWAFTKAALLPVSTTTVRSALRINQTK